jgi:KDO2-lipid IV(A) lauroyltransferase
MKRVVWLLQVFLIIAFTLPFAVLPYRLSLKSGEVIGVLLFYCWTSRRQIAIDNIRSAIARKAIVTDLAPEDLIRQNFRNLGRYFVEVIKVYYGSGARILRNVEFRGLDNAKRARDRGVGLFFITGHCGNWELLALAYSLKETEIHVVARALNNPLLNRLLEKVRKRYGNRVIYKKKALKNILSALRGNETVGILMDQSVVASEGVVVEFLGKKAYTLKMPAIMARKTGAAVLPAFISRVEGGHVVEIGDEVIFDHSGDPDQAVVDDTAKLTRCIEDYIRRNPSEWLWMHRRWKRIKD